jgi:hypothetical protein
LLVDYEVNGRASLRTLRSHLKVLRPAVAHLRAIDVTTDVVQSWQRRWQEKGTSNPTINRRCNMLRRAFRLGQRARKVHLGPFIPRLKEQSPRGRYITPTDTTAILAQLPAHLRDFFSFARLYGTRKGQLARTQRRFVDLDRGVIVWPPAESKDDQAHTLPLDGDGFGLVKTLMTRPPLFCPFLFHGPRCAPGQLASKEYGCLGDFKRAWRTAMKRAGLPIGRKEGGYTFHMTRNTAATDLRAGGMDEADAMKITGHQTAHVFKHYDLGNVDALRERLTRARKKAATVTRLRDSRNQRAAEARTDDSYTAAAQQPVASLTTTG